MSVSLNQYSHATNVVYIKENFTYSRRKLFTKVRNLLNDNHWRSAWTLDGKIFIKKFTGGTAKNNTWGR